MSYYYGNFFSTKLLEFSELHPKSLDKAKVMPSNMRMLGTMVVVERGDLFGDLGGNMLEFYVGA